MCPLPFPLPARIDPIFMEKNQFSFLSSPLCDAGCFKEMGMHKSHLKKTTSEAVIVPGARFSSSSSQSVRVRDEKNVASDESPSRSGPEAAPSSSKFDYPRKSEKVGIISI